jgi:hypothetical protein
MPMLLQIRGYHLPGQVWRSTDERYDNVHVGIQVGKEPATVDWISAARRSRAGPGPRFIYLTWGDVADDGSFTMFRRDCRPAR